jgi:Zinc finger, C2H2 type
VYLEKIKKINYNNIIIKNIQGINMQPTRRSSTQPRHSHKPNNTPGKQAMPWDTLPPLTFIQEEQNEVNTYQIPQSTTGSASKRLAASPALPTQLPAARPLTQGSSSRLDSSGARASGQASVRFACTEPGCKSSFTRKSSMYRHIRAVHEGEKNHPCPDLSCNKFFAKKNDAIKHYKSVHLNQKTHPCKIACGKFFSKKDHANKHYEEVHLNQQYVCSLCLATFSRRYNLNGHISSRVCTSGNKSKK